MSLIQRGSKPGGGRSFASEKAANPNAVISSVEVDYDFDTAYNLVNGHLDTTNLSPTAAIAATQLASAAGILGSQIAPGTIQRSNLAVGSTVGGTAFAGAGISGALGNITTAPVTVAQIGLQVRGGIVLLIGSFRGQVSIAGGISATFQYNIIRDATTLSGTPFYPCGTTATMILPLPSLVFIDIPVAGSHTYALQMVTNNPSVDIVFDGAGGGTFWGMEFA